MMRFVGETAVARRNNGFEHVRFLCTKQDFEIAVELYSFEKEAIRRAAGGENWTSSEYDGKFHKLVAVLNGGRPIAGPKLGLREVFKPRVERIRSKEEAGHQGQETAIPQSRRPAVVDPAPSRIEGKTELTFKNV